MPLSLNEIRDRALAFSKEWANEASEDAEAKSFWDGFFNVFGISRKRTATFETKVHKLGNKDGYIDLLWKGKLLIEHKSRGKDLERAYQQAKDYFPGLKEHELPRYIIVCDFERFHIWDLEDGWDKQFNLNKLVDNIHLFDFLSGYQRGNMQFRLQFPLFFLPKNPCYACNVAKCFVYFWGSTLVFFTIVVYPFWKNEIL
jgi:hypothetical protein